MILGNQQPMIDYSAFTPVQSRMLEVLRDGLPHTRYELHDCLQDEMGPISNIRSHLSSIRKKIRPFGEDIICELANRRICYRHVRLLASPLDG
jgi:hypothetical protein